MKIVFAELKPDVWQYKVATALKAQGIKTVSLSPLSIDKNISEAFDEVLSLDLKNLKPLTITKTFLKNPLKFLKTMYKTFTLKADAIICYAAPHYLSALFIMFYRGRFLRLYLPYDTNATIYPDLKKYFPKREIWGEKYSFLNCDGLIQKDSLDSLKNLPKSFKIEEKPVIQFESYPFEKWFVPTNPQNKISYGNKETHIVYTGTFLDTPVISMSSDFTEILRQKIHLHIYGRYPLSKEEIDKVTQNKKELGSYLHLHDFVSPEKLPQEISKYDFGLYYFCYNGGVTSQAAKYGFGNKRNTYFEAGIPMISHKDTENINRDVKERYLGIILSDIKQLKKSIGMFNYKKSVKNISEYRAASTIENNAPKLIKFIKKLKTPQPKCF